MSKSGVSAGRAAACAAVIDPLLWTLAALAASQFAVLLLVARGWLTARAPLSPSRPPSPAERSCRRGPGREASAVEAPHQRRSWPPPVVKAPARAWRRSARGSTRRETRRRAAARGSRSRPSRHV
eukprot:scaffold415_cov124-Isochrysis_galbana.AAC.13